jgi:uncharacterized membrane protein YfcA
MDLCRLSRRPRCAAVAPRPRRRHRQWRRCDPRTEVGGRFAALSSGFIGIGGGLATTVGLSAVLDVPQRQAQMASLVLSLIPTTIPAAGVYWRAGAMGPWPALLAVILGLVAGTDLGRGSALGSEAGRFARRCSPSSRRWRHTWRAKRGSPLERITQSRCSCIVRE